MNAPEKKVFILAVLMFALGIAVKISPWDPVPQIETFSFAESTVEWKSDNPPQAKLRADKSEAKKTKRKAQTKSKRPAVRFPISINRASAAELAAIKGVGPKLAERIVEFRSQNGAFAGPSDLQKVSGIGKKKAESILEFVFFD